MCKEVRGIFTHFFSPSPNFLMNWSKTVFWVSIGAFPMCLTMRNRLKIARQISGSEVGAPDPSKHIDLRVSTNLTGICPPLQRIKTIHSRFYIVAGHLTWGSVVTVA